MSEVKVDTISERTAAGGVTIDGVLIKDGVATFQTAAGSPLVFEGATANAHETTFAFTDPTQDNTITFPDSSFTVPTAGGLPYAQQWRLSADLSCGTSDTYLYANWEKPEAEDSPGVIGTDMVVDATTSATLSGAWTFPDTGVWHVTWVCITLSNGSAHNFTPKIWTTDDNGSNWYEAASALRRGHYIENEPSLVDYLVSISDVTNDKVRVSAIASADTSTILGDTNANQCALTFIKLGD